MVARGGMLYTGCGLSSGTGLRLVAIEEEFEYGGWEMRRASVTRSKAVILSK